MRFAQTPKWKIAYDQKINEINVERANIQTFYILISCIIMHFHGMYDLLGLSFSWPPYLFLAMSFLPFILNKIGFSFFIKNPFYDILLSFVCVYIFTDLLLSTVQHTSSSKKFIISLIKLAPFMVTSVMFPLKKLEVCIISVVQALLYYLLRGPSHNQNNSEVFIVLTFIFILLVMVFLINAHFNHKQILKDCVKTLEKEKIYKRLIKSEKKFRKLFESKAIASCMADKQGKIFQVSNCWLELFNRKTLNIGGDIKELFDSASPKIDFSEILEKENPPLKDGSKFVPAGVLNSSENKYFMIYAFYDTELEIIFINCKENTKEHTNSVRLVQEEKFAHLGKSSSGLAHDIFNPLSSLILNLELSQENLEEIQKKTRDGSIHNKNLLEARELISKGLESAEVIKTIVTQFKKFSRLFRSQGTKSDLYEIIQTGIDLFSLPLSDTVEFRVSGISKNQYFIKDEKNNFFQVFLNIFQNSYTSYLEKGTLKKIITVSIEKKSKTEIEIIITDFAKGIEKSHLKNVFDVSFSTKKPENSGGMGLFLCKDLIVSRSGSIKAQSKLGEGTSITIALPYFDSKNEALRENRPVGGLI